MNQRFRTDIGYNLHLLNEVSLEQNEMRMPIIKAISEFPQELIGFNYARTTSNFRKGVHFYLDDYQFERVWNQPERYAEMLRKFDFVFTPDFSLYMDMPKPLQIYNVYRNRLLGAYWQEQGINVIPTLSWSDEDSFRFAFSGIEPGGIVSVSTVGIYRNNEAREIWLKGMAKMIKIVRPKTILIYGKPIEFEHGDVRIVYFESTNLKGVR